MRAVRRGLGLGAVAVLLGACGLRGPSPIRYDEASFDRKPRVSYTIPTPRPGVPSETVVGEVRHVTVRQGDTLHDLARYYDLGFEEMQQANPGVDPWVPPVG